jgi:hypothetical protein
MSKCPKEGEPNTHKHEYKISIEYNLQKYLPANEWRGLTGDNIPARKAEYDKKKRDKQGIFSKYTKSSGGLRVGKTIMYMNKKRPEHHKKIAVITKVKKPPKKEEVYKKFLEGELKTYVEPPSFAPEYTIRFLDKYSADDLKVGDDVKRILKVKDLQKLKLQSTLDYTLCLPMKAEKMSDANLRTKLTDIVDKGFPEGMKFKPDVVKSIFKDTQSLPSIDDVLNNPQYGEKDQKIIVERLKSFRMNLDKDDLVPTDDGDHFKVISASLFDWQLNEEQSKIMLKVKLKITPDGKGAKVWVQNFFDGFDCEGHRASLKNEMTKLKPKRVSTKAIKLQKINKNKMLVDIKKGKIMDDYKKYREGPKGLARLQAIARGRQTRRNLNRGGRRTRKRRGGEKCPKVDINQFETYEEDKKLQHIRDIRQQCSKNKDCEWAMNDTGPQSYDCRELNCSADHKHTGKKGENCKPNGKCIFDWQTKKCAKIGDLKQDDFIFNLKSIRAALHKAVAEKREQREIDRLERMEADYQEIMINRDHDLEQSHGNFYRDRYDKWVPATPHYARGKAKKSRANRRPIPPGPTLNLDGIENPEEVQGGIKGETGTPLFRQSTEEYSKLPQSSTHNPKRSLSEPVVAPNEPPNVERSKSETTRKRKRGGKNRKKKTRRKSRRKSKRRRHTKKRRKKRKTRRRKYRK